MSSNDPLASIPPQEQAGTTSTTSSTSPAPLPPAPPPLLPTASGSPLVPSPRRPPPAENARSSSSSTTTTAHNSPFYIAPLVRRSSPPLSPPFPVAAPTGSSPQATVVPASTTAAAMPASPSSSALLARERSPSEPGGLSSNGGSCSGNSTGQAAGPMDEDKPPLPPGGGAVRSPPPPSPSSSDDARATMTGAGEAVEFGSSSQTGSSSSGARIYTLSIVQQPLRSSEFGSNVLARLPLSPPLIVRLEVTDSEGHECNIEPTLPFVFAHLTLQDASQDPESPTTLMSPSADLVSQPLSSDDGSASSLSAPVRLLYGTLVSSPHQLSLKAGSRPESPSGQGIYFVFPDVSVRVRGTYRLKVGLMRIAGPPGDAFNPPTHETLAHTVTGPFEIHRQQDYVAPPTTEFTATLAEQGVQMYLPRI